MPQVVSHSETRRLVRLVLGGLAGVLFHNFWAFEGREQVAQMLNLDQLGGISLTTQDMKNAPVA